MLPVALSRVHVADAVVLAPELGGGAGAVPLLRVIQRQWPGVLTCWCGRYGRPAQARGFAGSRHIRSEGPFEGSLDSLLQLIDASGSQGRRRRDGERDVGLAFARELNVEEGRLAEVLCVLLAHRVSDDRLHQILGQDRTAFTRYLSEAIYPLIGGPPLLNVVQHLRAFEQVCAPRERRATSRSQRVSRSA